MIKEMLNLDQAARNAHKELLTPIKNLEKFLKKELDGFYDTFERRGWREISEIQRIGFFHEFPGRCFFQSEDGKRNMIIGIYFDWSKWDEIGKKMADKIEFDITDQQNPPNCTYRVLVETLDDPKFIQYLRDWLSKDKWIPWEEFKI